ncbi:hypothetical protein AVEN_150350-1 [Araneus ventricosus]|uniref:Uncharacterized protein n=1 Tax=Araneus ventricosus TaxID=182803 RepID=A0A4Y2CQ23_ARAVE|nr:hypothetical protein AVEN_150350-1 [Araneus ventricosus]
MRSHRRSKRILSSPEGIASCVVLTSTPLTVSTSYGRGWPWSVMGVRTPTSVPELLPCRSGHSDFTARFRARWGGLYALHQKEGDNISNLMPYSVHFI